MPTTRSSKHFATMGSDIPPPQAPPVPEDTEKPKINTRKRKAESDLRKNVKPRKLPEDAHDQNKTVAGSSSGIPTSEEDLVPATLTFNFQAAKEHLIQADHRFKDLFSKLKCKPFEELEQVHPFRSLVTSILGQQVSWQAARSITHKFRRLFDPSLPEKPDDEENKVNGSFPTPQQVVATDGVTLRTAGLSVRKVEYVQDLAARFADGRLSTSKLLQATDEELSEMLIQVRGIGKWTVDMFAIFSLRRPDILPVGDLGVQRGVLRWMLSLHSNKHSYSISPEKVSGGNSTDSKKPRVDDDELPSLTRIASDVESTGEREMLPLPPTFTPSIKKVLDQPSVSPGGVPPSLPAGIDVALLKSRLDGKKKVKGALLTPQEMSALTESWKPYRSIDHPSPADSDLLTPSCDQPLESLSTTIPLQSTSTTQTATLSMDIGCSKRTLSEGLSQPKSGTAHSDKAVSSDCESPPLSILSNRAYNGLSSLLRDFSFGRSFSMDESRTKACSPSDTLNQADLTSSYPASSTPPETNGRCYSFHFPEGHHLNLDFVQRYRLQDELGSGGYGFVMTAYDTVMRCEVAVKFIIKDKVPEHAWMEDDLLGRLPTEVIILSTINHDNIVKSLDLYEDALYFYLVQELHGSPWHQQHRLNVDVSPSLCSGSYPSNPQSISTPLLSPSASESSLSASVPGTPPQVFSTREPQITDNGAVSTGSPDAEIPKLLHKQLSIAQEQERLVVTRRASHDLFECIEQSADKRLTEPQAQYVFSQVVDAVLYLETLGITHRDIKDENLVIDKDLKVKLIDFGSAIMVDPLQPRPSYKVFYGTAAYASSEILLKKDYQAAPAEIWTLGVLLSYLLVGVSPFPSARDAVEGNIFLSDKHAAEFSPDAMDLMRSCLDPNPNTRATIHEVKRHRWLSPASFQS
ncbi:hypothetical protein CVT24_003945 [Panaeolus cyanescens]|uniref:Protein kinase domain-containing protein n=1 Tax=Panaeolus cyanescens TaxID=181874 RepID=A0A409Y6E3_9AGAR|nr:hypothetical protein CVT24_003945 [Panaeolus cyanescens]